MSENFKLDKQLCFSLYNAQRKMNRFYTNKVFKDHNLTYPQYLVLSILFQTSPVNVKTLVEELSLDTGTISPLLKRMESNELIIRERSELDQREVFIHLTDKSRKLHPALENCNKIFQEAALLTDEEAEDLKHLLDKLIHNLDNEQK
ncbi:MarR family transcriptional regulator [Macrococcus hajekii]|uniref:HTH-type transcriptional regulator MgrA n=1 Tax=Macrococcus hajekii TaxID=198482 RepID=A0A4R6BIV4_9STAP|nr:MarR family transcriptional regulator [Macrococcus hajekii]TDM01527.1 MarR family transcriptional regulator [Macrococcus hajekii]GGB00736.1 HTH-type transcriptional regulator MgrA [Macrococcus hajekii]